MNRLVMSLPSVLVLSIAFGAWSLWTHSKPSVVSVDRARIRGQFIEQLAHHAASPDRVRKASIRFNQKLHAVLEDYAVHAHVLIIDRSFVLAGSVDVTQDIITLLSHAMGEKE